MEISKSISEATDGGQELVARLLDLSRNPKTPIRERVLCTTELLSRMVGTPMQNHQMLVAHAGLLPNLGAMTPSARLAWVDDERARLGLPPVGVAALQLESPKEQDETLEKQETDENDEIQ